MVGKVSRDDIRVSRHSKLEVKLVSRGGTYQEMAFLSRDMGLILLFGLPNDVWRPVWTWFLSYMIYGCIKSLFAWLKPEF